MLGIIIANWNGEKIIDKCLQSLVEQDYKNFKVYIIDNASKDKSIEIIERYSKEINIQLTKLDYNSGFAVANNIGIKQAIDDGCEYVFTLNNDVEVTKDAIENAMNEIAKKESDVYQMFMINYFNRDNCDAAGLNFNSKLIPIQVGFQSSIEEVLKSKDEISIEGVCAGAAIYSSAALESVKLENGDFFDSNFFAYYEDVDLSLRLRNSGFKFKLLKNSIVYHMHSATGNRVNGFKEYYLVRNLFMYTKRNQSAEDLKKNQYSYYIIFIHKFLKSIPNFKAMKLTVKGLRDGLKERKKYSYNVGK